MTFWRPISPISSKGPCCPRWPGASFTSRHFPRAPEPSAGCSFGSTAGEESPGILRRWTRFLGGEEGGWGGGGKISFRGGLKGHLEKTESQICVGKFGVNRSDFVLSQWSIGNKADSQKAHVMLIKVFASPSDPRRSCLSDVKYNKQLGMQRKSRVYIYTLLRSADHVLIIDGLPYQRVCMGALLGRRAFCGRVALAAWRLADRTDV